jgi:antitoxin component YwqK of YwqJK toxin-antitoxin module
MQKSVFFLLFLAFVTMSFVKQETVWLDKDLKKTQQDKASYYRTGSALKGEVIFYFKSRNIYRKVFYANQKPAGNFLEYYESGELKEAGTYAQGVREGNWKVYYKNGKIRQKGRYSKGEKVGVWKTFYKNN